MRQEEPRVESFHYEGGLSSFITFLNENKEAINPTVIYIESTKDDVVVDVALQYNDSYSENLLSFVNNINTIDGGTSFWFPCCLDLVPSMIMAVNLV